MRKLQKHYHRSRAHRSLKGSVEQSLGEIYSELHNQKNGGNTVSIGLKGKRKFKMGYLRGCLDVLV